MATACMTALFCATDYRCMGILMIFAMYQTREKDGGVRFMAAGLVMLLGTWGSNLIRYAGVYSADYLFRFSLRRCTVCWLLRCSFCITGKRGGSFRSSSIMGFIRYTC